MFHRSEDLSIQQTIFNYLDGVRLSRSENTYRTYRNGMQAFAKMLQDSGIDVIKTPVKELQEEAITSFSDSLKDLAPTTERLYLTAATSLFEFIAAENLAEINLPRIRLLIRQRARRPGIRLPQFPNDDIEKVLDYMIHLVEQPAADDIQQLIDLRDRAFLITLADTGLRVHEACNLVRGDIDWKEYRAVIIGKGNRQDIVRFSERSMIAVKRYLEARARIDGAGGKQLGRLPLFARHDRAAGKITRRITTTTGRNIVAERVAQAIGKDAVGTITPHSFRHYFVTRVLRGSGNLKLAQELARHRNIAVTQRYAHLSNDELDKGYWDVFEEK
ncbi:MAG TPA: tyrosine-type recombinase/integrase [Bellilinea sp.]|nr:tyrosine-type recombinase/integrase [Bellilinea sp.]